MKRIGFTGTQQGMTKKQKWEVHVSLLGVMPEEVHHGDCIGADADFHEIAVIKNPKKVVIHPPINQRKRAHKGIDHRSTFQLDMRPAKDYLARNRDIVDQTDMLIATPHNFTDIQRGSGTWYTIRYARKVGKPVVIIYPDGTKEGRMPIGGS